MRFAPSSRNRADAETTASRCEPRVNLNCKESRSRKRENPANFQNHQFHKKNSIKRKEFPHTEETCEILLQCFGYRTSLKVCTCDLWCVCELLLFNVDLTVCCHRQSLGGDCAMCGCAKIFAVIELKFNTLNYKFVHIFVRDNCQYLVLDCRRDETHRKHDCEHRNGWLCMGRRYKD